MNIFVGNLSFEASEDDLKKLFAGFGNTASVAVVMSKDKKKPRSRGFGFVEMPDEQQALAAIAALNGKEFMGRVINVEVAHPKGQKAMVWPPIAKAKTEAQGFNKHPALKDGRVRPLGQPGTYKGGRRTRSYVKQSGLAGIQVEEKPRRKSQDNPMRWRKRGDQPKPWLKSSGEHKPWKKTEGESRPWKKLGGKTKPIGTRTYRTVRCAPGGAKKPAGEAKPWSKGSERPQESKSRGRRKPGGYRRRSQGGV